MVSLFPLRIPVTGIGSFSLGPTHPVTMLPFCFNDAFPVIVPSDVEIVTRQVPVTSRALARATNGVTNNMLSSPRRSIMRVAPPFSTQTTREGS